MFENQTQACFQDRTAEQASLSTMGPTAGPRCGRWPLQRGLRWCQCELAAVGASRRSVRGGCHMACRLHMLKEMDKLDMQ